MSAENILGFSSSPRTNSNSKLILNTIMEAAEEAGAKVALFDLAKMDIKACVGCELCRGHGRCKGLKDDMTPLYEEIEAAKGLALVTPTHHYNVSVSMKAFIDRLYAYYDFSETRPRSWSSRLAGLGKKAVIATICEQSTPYDMGFTLEAMERPLKALGYDIVGKLAVMETFDAGGVKNNKSVLARAAELGKDLCRCTRA